MKKSVFGVIYDNFPLTGEEYNLLEQKFGKLAKAAAWKLLKNNTRNNHTNDFDDVNQELMMSLVKAGSYYKRQVYIQSCLKVAKEYVKDDFIRFLLCELDNLWLNRKRHGANKQKYGLFQEKILERIIRTYVPKEKRPQKDGQLVIDADFSTYCKSIVWNDQKSIGRKITREKPLRVGMCSLNEFDFLGA